MGALIFEVMLAATGASGSTWDVIKEVGDTMSLGVVLLLLLLGLWRGFKWVGMKLFDDEKGLVTLWVAEQKKFVASVDQANRKHADAMDTVADRMGELAASGEKHTDVLAELAELHLREDTHLSTSKTNFAIRKLAAQIAELSTVCGDADVSLRVRSLANEIEQALK